MAIDYTSLTYAVLKVLGNYISVDMERFAGLNIRGFSHTEVFAKILLHLPWPEVLAKYLRDALIFTEKFHGTVKNCENNKSLAQ